LNKTKSTLVLIDGVGDVLNEAVSSRIFHVPPLLTVPKSLIDVVNVIA
jgi:hypothetical protein